MYNDLKQLPPPKPLEYEPFVYEKPDKTSFDVVKTGDWEYEVFGALIDELSRGVVLDSYDSMQYFQRQLRERGIDKALKKAGVKTGDTVRMLDVEFEYVE